VATDQPSYQLGAIATFSLAVDNPSDVPLTMTFPSAQLYDLSVLKGDQEVWRWSDERMFATVLTDRTFPPGVTLLGRETWDWHGGDGAPLPPGTYRVVGSLATSPPRLGNNLDLSLRPR
jgi:hypothetical protein